eukprot:Nk52_evm62s2367 gene=Nk52_evmTU62s2367
MSSHVYQILKRTVPSLRHLTSEEVADLHWETKEHIFTQLLDDHSEAFVEIRKRAVSGAKGDYSNVDTKGNQRNTPTRGIVGGRGSLLRDVDDCYSQVYQNAFCQSVCRVARDSAGIELYYPIYGREIRGSDLVNNRQACYFLMKALSEKINADAKKKKKRCVKKVAAPARIGEPSPDLNESAASVDKDTAVQRDLKYVRDLKAPENYTRTALFKEYGRKSASPSSLSSSSVKKTEMVKSRAKGLRKETLGAGKKQSDGQCDGKGRRVEVEEAGGDLEEQMLADILCKAEKEGEVLSQKELAKRYVESQRDLFVYRRHVAEMREFCEYIVRHGGAIEDAGERKPMKEVTRKLDDLNRVRKNRFILAQSYEVHLQNSVLLKSLAHRERTLGDIENSVCQALGLLEVKENIAEESGNCSDPVQMKSVMGKLRRQLNEVKCDGGLGGDVSSLILPPFIFVGGECQHKAKVFAQQSAQKGKVSRRTSRPHSSSLQSGLGMYSESPYKGVEEKLFIIQRKLEDLAVQNELHCCDADAADSSGKATTSKSGASMLLKETRSLVDEALLEVQWEIKTQGDGES